MAREISLSKALVSVVILARKVMASWSSGARSVQLFSPQGMLAVNARGSTANAMGGYEVMQQHPGTSFDGLQVCVWVHSKTGSGGEEHSTTSGPVCFDKEKQELPMKGLEVGSHRLSTAVVAPGEAETGSQPAVISPMASTEEFKVVLQEDFVPNYEWQDLLEWHSVPPGLEVVLPLDGVGRKRARIPPTWQLQKFVTYSRNIDSAARSGEEKSAVVADGDGFFVRTEVRPDSSVSDLRRDIARHPGMAGREVECVELSMKGRLLDDEETVLSLDLFNRVRDLVAVVDRGKLPTTTVI